MKDESGTSMPQMGAAKQRDIIEEVKLTAHRYSSRNGRMMMWLEWAGRWVSWGPSLSFAPQSCTPRLWGQVGNTAPRESANGNV